MHPSVPCAPFHVRAPRSGMGPGLQQHLEANTAANGATEPSRDGEPSGAPLKPPGACVILFQKGPLVGHTPQTPPLERHHTQRPVKDTGEPSAQEGGPRGQRPCPPRPRVPLLPPRGAGPQHTRHGCPSSTPPELGLQRRAPGLGPESATRNAMATKAGNSVRFLRWLHFSPHQSPREKLPRLRDMSKR